MMSDELTPEQNTVIDWIFKQHNEHPERDVFQVMGRLYVTADHIEYGLAPDDVVKAYRKLTVAQRNRAGSYAALPF